MCFSATQYIKRVLKIDDSLDVFPVHGVGGILGSLIVAVFASTELGVFSGYGFADGISSIAGQFSIQAIGVVSIIVFTAIATYVILKLVSALTGGLRVDSEDEVQGLDVTSHEETGYNL